VVVEDTDIGVQAALAAGMSVFALRIDGITPSSEVCVIDRLGDISRYLV
jgi:beta-phosphoglucomutase-like phosphatase (HAD superfamily)